MKVRSIFLVLIIIIVIVLGFLAFKIYSTNKVEQGSNDTKNSANESENSKTSNDDEKNKGSKKDKELDKDYEKSLAELDVINQMIDDSNKVADIMEELSQMIVDSDGSYYDEENDIVDLTKIKSYKSKALKLIDLCDVVLAYESDDSWEKNNLEMYENLVEYIEAIKSFYTKSLDEMTYEDFNDEVTEFNEVVQDFKKISKKRLESSLDNVKENFEDDTVERTEEEQKAIDELLEAIDDFSDAQNDEEIFNELKDKCQIVMNDLEELSVLVSENFDKIYDIENDIVDFTKIKSYEKKVKNILNECDEVIEIDCDEISNEEIRKNAEFIKAYVKASKEFYGSTLEPMSIDEFELITTKLNSDMADINI